MLAILPFVSVIWGMASSWNATISGFCYMMLRVTGPVPWSARHAWVSRVYALILYALCTIPNTTCMHYNEYDACGPPQHEQAPPRHCERAKCAGVRACAQSGSRCIMLCTCWSLLVRRTCPPRHCASAQKCRETRSRTCACARFPSSYFLTAERDEKVSVVMYDGRKPSPSAFRAPSLSLSRCYLSALT
jgi:hypothetical protein